MAVSGTNENNYYDYVILNEHFPIELLSLTSLLKSTLNMSTELFSGNRNKL